MCLCYDTNNWIKGYENSNSHIQKRTYIFCEEKKISHVNIFKLPKEGIQVVVVIIIIIIVIIIIIIMMMIIIIITIITIIINKFYQMGVAKIASLLFTFL